MQIRNNTSKENSLYHDTLSLLGIDETDTSTLSFAKFIRSANNAYRQVDTWIWQVSGYWQFDDSNYETLPIATSDLVEDQKDYEIPSGARKMERAEIMDSDGDYYTIDAIDKSEVSSAMSEFHEESGAPRYYDMVGRSIKLYPAPSADNVTLSSGLKIYVARDISEFTTSDTTKEPGFDNHFHRLISYLSANDFASGYGLNKNYNEEMRQLKVDLEKFYGSRNQEMRVSIKPVTRSSI